MKAAQKLRLTLQKLLKKLQQMKKLAQVGRHPQKQPALRLQSLQEEVRNPAAGDSPQSGSPRQSLWQARLQQPKRQVAGPTLLPRAELLPLLPDLQLQPSQEERLPEVLLAKGEGPLHEVTFFGLNQSVYVCDA